MASLKMVVKHRSEQGKLKRNLLCVGLSSTQYLAGRHLSGDGSQTKGGQGQPRPECVEWLELNRPCG